MTANHTSRDEVTDKSHHVTWTNHDNDKSSAIVETREDINKIVNFDLSPTAINAKDDIRRSGEFKASEIEQTRETPETSNEFVDVETLGLRRSPRMQERNQARPLQPKSRLNKATKDVGLFAMTLTSIHNGSYNQAKSCYSSNLIRHQEMLDSNSMDLGIL